MGLLTRYLIKLFRLLRLKQVFFPYLGCGHSRWIKWETSKCFFFLEKLHFLGFEISRLCNLTHSTLSLLDHQATTAQEKTRNLRKGSNSPIKALMKVQEIQKGQEAPHNGNAILPKDIQMAPFRLKGLIDPIMNTRLMGGLEGVDGSPSGHPNLNNGHPSLRRTLREEYWASNYILHLSDQRE
jgi:hypothetical protein